MALIKSSLYYILYKCGNVSLYMMNITVKQYISPECEICIMELDSPILSVSSGTLDIPSIGGPEDTPWQ